MGLRSWWRRATSPRPRRPWVRPEFLAVAVVAGAAVGFALWGSQEAPRAAPSPEVRQEYVGLDPDEVPAVDCAPVCRADALLAEWQGRHPDASILEAAPRLHEGRLVGYDVTYRE